MSLTLDAPPVRGLDAQPRRETRRVLQHSPRWACVYTHAQAETWANTNLRRAGYQTYLPTCAVRVRDRVVPSMHHTVTRPLFPRYLFVMFDHTTASWSPIRATPGVADILRAGNVVHYLNAGDLTALRAGEDRRATPPPPGASIAAGDAVRVASGPVRDVDAAVIAVHGDTARIGLVMFGQLRQITVPITSLVARAG